ncbi:MAG TPA: hypothetical protein VGP20_11585 [Steroidobacteraceae bacterium]|jgi:hypothetical protein|nr:hypothetical protein [Steroidobacteraceae bacterium]
MKIKCASRASALTPAWIAALAAALILLVSVTTRAETVAVDDQVSVRQSDIDRPGRGMSMKSVEAKFGAPQERHQAVGNPPITRWDYPLFTVFFEHEYVIHAVVNPGT